MKMFLSDIFGTLLAIAVFLLYKVHTNFPREGGQSTKVIHYKMWKALHPPLTIALFILLALHVWDVFGP